MWGSKLVRSEHATSESDSQVPDASAWPSLSPVGSMTMLGSSLKDEDILPESPVLEPCDLISSYLPETHTQASSAVDAWCSTMVLLPKIKGLCTWLVHHWLMPGTVQAEEATVQEILPEDTADIQGTCSRMPHLQEWIPIVRCMGNLTKDIAPERTLQLIRDHLCCCS